MTKNGAAQPANYSTALQLYYWKNVYTVTVLDISCVYSYYNWDKMF